MIKQLTKNYEKLLTLTTIAAFILGSCSKKDNPLPTPITPVVNNVKVTPRDEIKQDSLLIGVWAQNHYKGFDWVRENTPKYNLYEINKKDNI